MKAQCLPIKLFQPFSFTSSDLKKCFSRSNFCNDKYYDNLGTFGALKRMNIQTNQVGQLIMWPVDLIFVYIVT